MTQYPPLTLALMWEEFKREVSDLDRGRLAVLEVAFYGGATMAMTSVLALSVQKNGRDPTDAEIKTLKDHIDALCVEMLAYAEILKSADTPY